MKKQHGMSCSGSSLFAKSGRVNIEERRRQRAAAQRSAAGRIGEGLAGMIVLRILNVCADSEWGCMIGIAASNDAHN